MKKLKRKLKNTKCVSKLIDILIYKTYSSKNDISFDSWDGFIIGLIYSNSGYIAMLILEKHCGPMTDNSIQQLELCVSWICKKEKFLIELYKNYKDKELIYEI